jgi:hypothetical protein
MIILRLYHTVKQSVYYIQVCNAEYTFSLLHTNFSQRL